MRIKRIELEGKNGTWASIERAIVPHGIEPEGNYIEVVVHGSKCQRTFHVKSDDEKEQFKMGKHIQEVLDGCVGTNSMIHDYFRFIQLFGD